VTGVEPKPREHIADPSRASEAFAQVLAAIHPLEHHLATGEPILCRELTGGRLPRGPRPWLRAARAFARARRLRPAVAA
jgi:hypothetical protein